MLNVVVLMGRLVADVKTTQLKDHTVAEFRLAVEEGKNADGTSKAIFLDCKAFDSKATQFIHKGDKVVVNGRITVRSYQDKNGNKLSVSEIIANSIEFAEVKKPVEAKSEETPF